jgi:hypothetical protein
MQARKMNWATTGKRITGYSAVAALIIYGAIFAISKKSSDNFYDCGMYTKSLKGGVKVFDEKKYNVVLCGTGGDENAMDDRIRLQIFSANGELLAQRKFYAHWMMTNFRKELAFSADHVTYYDNSRQSNFEHRISMPPTTWDWISARLPLLS